MAEKRQRFVLVPTDNVFNDGMRTESKRLLSALSLPGAIGLPLSAAMANADLPLERTDDSGEMRVLDSVDLNESALVEMTPTQAARLSRRYPGLLVRPEGRLHMLKASPAGIRLKAARLPTTSVVKTLRIRCIDTASGAPVADADVTVVLDRRKRRAILDLHTDASGEVRTALPSTLSAIDAVIATPLAGYWAAQQLDTAVAEVGETLVEIGLVPLDGHAIDSLAAMLEPASPQDGKGVRVAVIDGGTANVAGLNIVQRINMTGTEDPAEVGDNGSGHGTHVAGIIARLAPKAELLAYRVFEKGAATASELAIAKAIRDAVDRGCDLINLSLGQATEPVTITRETRRARALGVVCIGAAGNGWMSAVDYPARSSHMVAASACGKFGTFPDGAMTGSLAADSPAPVDAVFFARFSNIGNEVDFIAPGVGVISWVGDAASGVMDGTSMACPAVTGQIARLLSRNSALRTADRDQQRSDDIIRMAHEAAVTVGFGRVHEGSGRIG